MSTEKTAHETKTVAIVPDLGRLGETDATGTGLGRVIAKTETEIEKETATSIDSNGRGGTIATRRGEEADGGTMLQEETSSRGNAIPRTSNRTDLP